MLTIGIIGCGSWAQLMHVPALQKLIADKEIRVAAISDINREHAETCAKLLNCTSIYNDYQEMLDDSQLRSQLDAVSILVPYHISECIISNIAERKLPFLCEKPPASNAIAQQKLIQCVGNTPHIVAYNRRFSPYIMAAREWMLDQDIQSVTTEFCRHQRCEAGFSSTFVHGLDTTLYLLGDAVAGLPLRARHTSTNKTTSAILDSRCKLPAEPSHRFSLHPTLVTTMNITAFAVQDEQQSSPSLSLICAISRDR